ncbi:beta-ribofuranosylaminobenzene 5'-phosphate synthase family protein [Halobellus salinisoli]|uniref:beta-ribofuranosylaminobenzene 5'-phosphate synthase family protein n=1 Tax=Halobellus salinisoli TaxID=3108500 RepID=UPI00300A77C4
MAARITGCARLHFGFRNLSPKRDRLFGGLGVTLERPRVVVEADPAAGVLCTGAASVDDETVAAATRYARRAVSLLDVDGARVTVERSLPRHVGLGSGTQLALSTLTAIARAHGRDPAIRENAGRLGRGRRSGVGIAAFEAGGFVLDRGIPTEAYPVDSAAGDDPTAPPLATRKAIPEEWRFLLVLPDVSPGKSGDGEDTCMRTVVRRANPSIADRIDATVTQRVLPALVDEDVANFGRAVTTVDRLNGLWYADEQGDTYRPPVGSIVDEVTDSPAVFGAGQSSWGPAVYGVTTAGRAAAAREAGVRALSRAGISGTVTIVAGRNRGSITSKNKINRKN